MFVSIILKAIVWERLSQPDTQTEGLTWRNCKLQASCSKKNKWCKIHDATSQALFHSLCTRLRL